VVNRKDLDGVDYEKILRGYTYVVPTSTPRIDDIIPKEGLADGGYVVEIFGFDFRDYRQVIDNEGNVSDTIRADVNDKRTSIYNPNYEVLASPLYPRVYFGDKEGEILEFAYEYMQVIIPPGQGAVDVYLINNDSGISNRVRFNYKTSQPAINSVSPSHGNRHGGDIVDLEGRDFQEGNITLLKKEYDEDNNSLRETIKMAMVKVGSRSNINLPREDDNSGVIRSSRATVTLAGGLSVRYNGSHSGSVEVSIEDRGRTYTHSYINIPDGAFYINTKDLKYNNEHYNYEELIKIEIKDNRLLVEGGYAPEVIFKSSGQLSVTMPYYYTIGNVNIEVINPDGGKARSNFEYKNPDSKPYINNITREGDRGPIEDDREGYGKVKVLQLNYKGGNIVSITGGDFRENAIIEIAGVGRPIRIDSGNINYDLPSKLTFTMPEVPQSYVGKEKLYRVIVSNRDGGFASTDKLDPPIYIEFIKGESEPILGNITPNRGPATGGTRVKITGDDFRKSMEGFEG
ncbi:MAG: cell surface receptor IPT/TIG domain-containing protein, partial [Tissierellia bacterium]|nr:cell surface receptor IPT/TIG domain-containing protein [Tissierellia bacterium]